MAAKNRRTLGTIETVNAISLKDPKRTSADNHYTGHNRMDGDKY